MSSVYNCKRDLLKCKKHVNEIIITASDELDYEIISVGNLKGTEMPEFLFGNEKHCVIHTWEPTSP